MNITFRLMKNADRKTITKLMFDFYEEDTYVKNITIKKIKNTFIELGKYPEKGCIFVVENKSEIIGYALLVNYWSNEFGGNILHIDELFIRPIYRRKGIGTKFFHYIIDHYVNNPVALQLEVTKKNKRGEEFYKNFGFSKSKYNRLILELDK